MARKKKGWDVEVDGKNYLWHIESGGVYMVLTVRDGRIARLEWYPDHDSAVAAARRA